MQKIFITDIDGILGQALAELLSLNSGFEIFGIGYKNKLIQNNYKTDRSNLKDLKSVIYEIKPDYIINTYMIFDAEEAFADKNRTMNINFKFSENITRIASVIESKIIAFSDYNVFNGATIAYDESAAQNPNNYVGKTLHMHENALKISNVPYTLFRLGFLMGFDVLNINNDLSNKFLSKLEKSKYLEVPEGKVQPVFVNDLAVAVEYAIENEVFDIFNFAGDNLIEYKELYNKFAEFFMLKDFEIKEIPNKNYVNNVELLNLKAKTFFNINYTEYSDIINFIKFKNN